MHFLVKQHDQFQFQLRLWIGGVTEVEAVRLVRECGWKFKGPMTSYDSKFDYYFFVYKPWGENDLTPEFYAQLMIGAVLRKDSSISVFYVAKESPDSIYINTDEDFVGEEDYEDYESDEDYDGDDSESTNVPGEDQDENGKEGSPLEDQDLEPAGIATIEPETTSENSDQFGGQDESNGHSIINKEKYQANTQTPIGGDTRELENPTSLLDALDNSVNSLLESVSTPSDLLLGPTPLASFELARSRLAELYGRLTLTLLAAGYLEPSESVVSSILAVAPSAISNLPGECVLKVATWVAKELTGRPDLVSGFLERVEQLPPALLLELAKSYEKINAYDKMLKVLRMLEGDSYKLAEVYRLFARAYRDSDTEKAEHYILRAYHEDPENYQLIEEVLAIVQDRTQRLKVVDEYLSRITTWSEALKARNLFEERVRCLAEFSGPSNKAFINAVLDLMEVTGYDQLKCVQFYNTYVKPVKLGHRDLMSILTSMPSCPEVLDEVERIAVEETARLPRADTAVLRDAYMMLRSERPETARTILELYRESVAEFERDPLVDMGQTGLNYQVIEDHEIDLKNERIVIVGGAESVRRRIVVELGERFGVDSVAEIPPSWERNLTQDEVNRILKGASIIVLITGAIKHATSNMVNNWLKRQKRRPRVVYPAGRGSSGVLIAILNALTSDVAAS